MPQSLNATVFICSIAITFHHERVFRLIGVCITHLLLANDVPFPMYQYIGGGGVFIHIFIFAVFFLKDIIN